MGRRFIRHPTDIAIEYRLGAARSREREHARNLSAGGLCFRAREALEPGCRIDITIRACDPPFRAAAQVVWCRGHAGTYHVGVRFLDDDKLYAARMVEQICHIEQYRIDALESEGRALTSEQAAAEWIAKHAAGFPRL